VAAEGLVTTSPEPPGISINFLDRSAIEKRAHAHAQLQPARLADLLLLDRSVHVFQQQQSLLFGEDAIDGCRDALIAERLTPGCDEAE
jgi:hypothetical protein